MLTKSFHLIVAGVLATSALACGEETPPPPSQPPPSKAGQGVNILTKGTENAGTGQPTPPAEGAAAAAAAAAGSTAPAQPTEAKEDEVSEIAYAYSPIGKRDPFRSLLDQVQGDEEGPARTELQTFEVDQLKLVAIISRVATPSAMVEDPNGKGHTLTRGTLIGKNWGRVSEINPECVVVKEEYRDYTGRKVTNKLNLCLPKPEELKLD